MDRPPRSHRELDVYKHAMNAVAMVIHLTRRFPPDEKFEMIAQMRASSRSVCSAIAEAWRKRNYPAAFASKLTEAESEAAETQTWADIAVIHQYLSKEEAQTAIDSYEVTLGQLVRLRISASKWHKH